MGAKAPKPSGPTAEQKQELADKERKAKEREEAANKEVQSQSAAAYGRRTGRRSLLSPERQGGGSTLG